MPRIINCHDGVWVKTLCQGFAVAAILFILGLFPAASQAVEDIPDTAISIAVDTQLLHDVNIPSHLISVYTENGVVTLNGVVDNILAKERSGKIAATVRGVRSVINMITVLPQPRPTDQEIKAAAEKMLSIDPATDEFEVDVQVKNGVVTLSGTVDSYQEGILAGKVVKGVDGVVELRNNLTFEPLEVRPDEKIKAEIYQRLYWDVWVNEDGFDIQVLDGRVSISGTARSAEEADRVKYLAWVNAVRSVDMSGVEVDWFKGNVMVRDKKPINVTDADIEGAIRDGFSYDPRLTEPEDIKVKVENGIVTLTGSVTYLPEKHALENDAANTIGVYRVKNLVKVQPESKLSDAAVLKNVEEAIAADKYVSADQVDVSVLLGRVYLRGTVESYFEKEKAGETAAKQKGVVAVENNISVYKGAPESEDWEILEDIKSELWWSPFVDEKRIKVSVKDGVAYLSGEVDNINQRKIAEDNAYEGGAVEVIDYLKVKNHPYYQGTAMPAE